MTTRRTAHPRWSSTRRVGAPVTIRLISSNERLPAVKRNHGLAVATGELVLFMNDDVWLRPRPRSRRTPRPTRPTTVRSRCSVTSSSPSQMSPTPFVQWYRPFAYDRIADRGMERGALPVLLVDEPLAPAPGDARSPAGLPRGLGQHRPRGRRARVSDGAGPVTPSSTSRMRGASTSTPRPRQCVPPAVYSVGRGLRDLKVLIPEPELLERYGVFSFANSPRAVARGSRPQAALQPFHGPDPATPARAAAIGTTGWRVVLLEDAPAPHRSGLS